MSDILQDEFEAVTAEAVNEATVSDLIPTGTYEGVLLDFTSKVIEYPDSPFNGHKMIRAHVELYDCPKDSGKTRHHYFNLSPTVVTGANGMRGESKLAAQLAKQTNTVGQAFNHALEAAKTTRFRYRVRLSEAKGDYEARNWTDAITAAPSGV